jgi:L-threonylcarbamoyladenylate synthase
VTGSRGPQVVPIRSLQPADAAEAIEAACREVAGGGLLIIPTETVYGIAGDPANGGAMARLFEAKRRPRGLNLPVLAGDPAEAWELGRPNPVALALSDAFWPGPLTMVLPRSERSRPWSLGRRPDSIALRVPDHTLAAAIIGRAGPLAATSANLSGQAPIDDPERLVGSFGDQVGVYVVLEAGVDRPSGQPSTVVDLTGDDVVVARWGGIDAENLDRVLRKLGRSAGVGRLHP